MIGVGDNCHDVKTCRNFGRCRLTGGPLGECDKAVKKESGADHSGEKTAEGSGQRTTPPSNDSFLTVETLVHLPPRQAAREGTFAWIREDGQLLLRTDASITGWRNIGPPIDRREVPAAIKLFKQSVAGVMNALERTAPLEHLPGCIPAIRHEPALCAPDCPTLYDRSEGQDEGNSGVSGEHPLALDTLGPIKPHRFYYRPGTL